MSNNQLRERPDLTDEELFHLFGMPEDAQETPEEIAVPQSQPFWTQPLVLIACAVLMLVTATWYFYTPSNQPPVDNVVMQVMPTAVPEFAESLFTNVSPEGYITVTAQDLKVLTNESLSNSRMPPMIPGTEIRLTGTSLPEVTAAFNTWSQAADQEIWRATV